MEREVVRFEGQVVLTGMCSCIIRFRVEVKLVAQVSGVEFSSEDQSVVLMEWS